MNNVVADDSSLFEGLHTPERVWFELHRENDACDVLVQMDDGTVYTALFAIMDYVQRQMDLQLQVTQQIDDTPQVRYCVIDTPHVLVEELTREVIEDTIDNMIALDVFESHFTRVTQNADDTSNSTRTSNDGTRATQEVAAVVISDVLVVQE
ncbi:MAG: hypothetical protein AAFR67_02120 [Chloroflexota bacterium]